jgi:hypothetical protein
MGWEVINGFNGSRKTRVNHTDVSYSKKDKILIKFRTEGSEFECRWGQDFSLLMLFRSALGSTQPGIKRPGRVADHSPPTNAEVKKTWVYTSNPLYAFMAWC